MSRILVISTVDHADDALSRFVSNSDVVKVVVPAVRQGILDWLANDEQAFRHATASAEVTAEGLPGETVEAVAGEADVALAISDALAAFPADEILIAVHPEDEASYVESLATENAPHRTFQGIPVRYVVTTE